MSATEDDPSTEQVPREPFAMYGFSLEIQSDWRVEMNPKVTRKKGDVAFHSKMGNRLFVSWGPLDDATKRFKTLEEHRDWNIEQIRKMPSVSNFEVTNQTESLLNGHRALFAHVVAGIKKGFGGKSIVKEDMWSVRFYCPNLSRYYVMYTQLKDALEFKDYGTIFNEVAASFRCHPE
jgi:hypothetical protein